MTKLPQSAPALDDQDAPAPPNWPIDRIGLVLGPAVLASWLLGPWLARWLEMAPSGLTPEAYRLAGVMLLTIIWWVTEPIPIAVTGLVAVVLCVFLGAVPGEPKEAARTVLAPFADPSVFFLLGGIYIGRAMTRHGLDRRLALSVLCTRWAGRSPATVLFAVGLAVTLISMWISNTAATAMMYPVTLGIIAALAGGSGDQSGAFARSPYASALLLITAYASSVGGVATPIGTATNVVAMGFFRTDDYFGRSADFFHWCLVGVPMMVFLFIGLFVWLRRRTSKTGLAMDELRQYLRTEHAALGPWRRGEINTLAVFLIVAALWVTPGVLSIISQSAGQAFSARFPEEITALLAPVLLFLVPVDWSKRQFTLESSDLARIDWGTVLLFGAGLSLGGLMFKTGLAKVIGQGLFDVLPTHDVWVITALAIASGIVLSEFTSNAAAASTLIPVIYALTREAGVDPLPPLLGVTFGASFGSALPVSTPPNAIVYSSGLIPVRRMIVAGVVLDLLSAVVIWVSLRLAFALGWRVF